jgi:hypothetical protein
MRAKLASNPASDENETGRHALGAVAASPLPSHSLGECNECVFSRQGSNCGQRPRGGNHEVKNAVVRTVGGGGRLRTLIQKRTKVAQAAGRKD